VVVRFAERLGDGERLAQLYLLTLCDTAMTAPNNLNAWKDELLRTLYVRARDHLAAGSGRPATAADVDPAVRRAKVVALVGGGEHPIDAAVAGELVAGIDDRFLSQLSVRQAARHLRLMAEVTGRGARVGILVSHYPLKGHSEVAVMAPDAHGVLAAIAGALVAARVDVLGAVVGHADLAGGGSRALDLFFVRDLVGAAIDPADPRWPRLERDLIDLVGGGPPDPAAVAALLARRRPPSGLPPRVTPGVATEIRVDNTESADATIVEVFTRDHPGVLYAITQTLADLELDISLSKISTEGEKAADVFYVTRAGAKVTDPEPLAAIRTRLAAVLEE